MNQVDYLKCMNYTFQIKIFIVFQENNIGDEPKCSNNTQKVSPIAYWSRILKTKRLLETSTRKEFPWSYTLQYSICLFSYKLT